MVNGAVVYVDKAILSHAPLDFQELQLYAAMVGPTYIGDGLQITTLLLRKDSTHAIMTCIYIHDEGEFNIGIYKHRNGDEQGFQTLKTPQPTPLLDIVPPRSTPANANF